MSRHKVLVIIVTYNGMKWMSKCMHTLYNTNMPIDVVVIDNGSTDGTQKFIIENYPQAQFIQSQQNLGFGKANNIGILKAIEENYDYAFLLNQDGYLEPDT